MNMNLIKSNNQMTNDPATTMAIFADPVGYLETHGIVSEVISESGLPAAA